MKYTTDNGWVVHVRNERQCICGCSASNHKGTVLRHYFDGHTEEPNKRCVTHWFDCKGFKWAKGVRVYANTQVGS